MTTHTDITTAAQMLLAAIDNAWRGCDGEPFHDWTNGEGDECGESMRAAITALRAALDAPASPASAGYAAWREFCAQRITQWLTLDELRAEVGRLSEDGAPSPELLMIHAMHLLDTPAAQAEPIDVLADYSGERGERQWVSVGTWLRPGERILHAGPAALDAQPAPVGADDARDAAIAEMVADMDAQCDVPPLGWRCTRARGHEGPCAAVACPHEPAILQRAMDKLRAGDAQPAPAPVPAEPLRAAIAACDRIIEQYGGIQCGIDFHALRKGLTAAAPAAPVVQQPGWTLMPNDPTPEIVAAMAQAWADAVDSNIQEECVAEYRAAIAAAPQAPTGRTVRRLTPEQIDAAHKDAAKRIDYCAPSHRDIARAVEDAFCAANGLTLAAPEGETR